MSEDFKRYSQENENIFLDDIEGKSKFYIYNLSFIKDNLVMILTEIVENAGKYVKDLLFENGITYEKGYCYHNWEHTKSVFNEVTRLANRYGYNPEYIELLQLAALFHDTGFIKQYDNNEPIGAEIAQDWLEKNNYPKDKIDIVKQLILATIVDYKPKNNLEAIIKDADLRNLGDTDFKESSDNLRKELEIIKGLNFSYEEWLQKQSSFIKGFSFYTDIQNQDRQTMLLENKKLLP